LIAQCSQRADPDGLAGPATAATTTSVMSTTIAATSAPSIGGRHRRDPSDLFLVADRTPVCIGQFVRQAPRDRVELRLQIREPRRRPHGSDDRKRTE
jgi:hypothetical protein